MGIKAQELVDGCFAKAKLDTRMFVLLDTDPSFAPVVRYWAALYRERKLQEGAEGHELARCIVKHTSALELANEVDTIQFNRAV